MSILGIVTCIIQMIVYSSLWDIKYNSYAWSKLAQHLSTVCIYGQAYLLVSSLKSTFSPKKAKPKREEKGRGEGARNDATVSQSKARYVCFPLILL
jgi:hypothetical protein